MTYVKICGLKDPAALSAAIENGADFVGFVFYPPSSRFIDIEVAAELVKYVPTTIKIVGLFVNADDRLLRQVLDHVPLAMIQLHGQETPQRVVEIKNRFGLPVMKAIAVAGHEDLELVSAYEEVSDWLLFDTKTREHGGSGQTFDWTILQGRSFQKPWMLAGGLRRDNITEALSILRPDAVDVSSGVEREKGVKDPEKIREFLKLIRKLDKAAEND